LEGGVSIHSGNGGERAAPHQSGGGGEGRVPMGSVPGGSRRNFFYLQRKAEGRQGRPNRSKKEKNRTHGLSRKKKKAARRHEIGFIPDGRKKKKEGVVLSNKKSRRSGVLGFLAKGGKKRGGGEEGRVFLNPSHLKKEFPADMPKNRVSMSSIH